MPHDTVLLEVAGPVATVTLNRPEAYNAIDPALSLGLLEAMSRVGADASIRAVILTGAGKAFCAGGDLKHIFGTATPRATLRQLVTGFHAGVQEMRAMGKPIVGAIQGVAAGGGLSLALACDLRILASTATMKVAYPSAGLSIDGGGTFALPRIVGLAKAMELALRDPVIGAEECRRIGLATEVVPPDQVLPRSRELAADLASRSAPALAAAKRLLSRSLERTLETQLEEERELICACRETPEAAEAMAAFREKRKPVFYR